ncbi:hypothetical protein PAXINDRAFT_79183, partial [Paxillus involutus ATCC 200175]
SRLGVMASISSMNSRHGHTFASSKVSLSVFSDSPDIPDTIDEEKMSDKRAKRTPAIAFANSVLPHPGGPCNNTPLGGCTPVCR